MLEGLRGWQAIAPEVPLAAASTPDHPLLRELSAAPMSSEALAGACALPLATVLAQLTELEVDGLVSCDNGLWAWRRPL